MPDPHDIELEEAFARRRMSRALFVRLAALVRPYRRIFVYNLIFTLLATLSQLLGPKFIQLGIDRYLTGVVSAAEAQRGMLIISALYLANLLLGWGLSVAQVKSAIRVGQNAINDLNKVLLKDPQNVDLLLLRAECKEAHVHLEGSIAYLDAAKKDMEGTDAYDAEYRRQVQERRDRVDKQLFELNRENNNATAGVRPLPDAREEAGELGIQRLYRRVVPILVVRQVADRVDARFDHFLASSHPSRGVGRIGDRLSQGFTLSNV